MTPVFGIGFAKEEALAMLPAVLPAEFSFCEVPGELLDNSAALAKLKRLSKKQKKALVIRDIMPPYLLDVLPGSPLRLLVEFDSKFRSRCQTASEIGVRIVGCDFNIQKALSDSAYRDSLIRILQSAAGILSEYNLLMVLPLHLSAGFSHQEAERYLDFKHRLFYPGFRYRIDFSYSDPACFEALDVVEQVLAFERNFWRIPGGDGEERFQSALLEKLKPVWNVRGRIPVFVSVDTGSVPPGQGILEQIAGEIRIFHNCGAEGENHGGQ